VVAVHGKYAVPPSARMVYASVFSHPTAKPQTEARYRASHSRTKQKRGPPSLI
jgi:hypothetical protein